MVGAHATVFLPPTKVGLFYNPYLPTGFCGGHALAEEDLSLSDFVDDLFRGISLDGHIRLPFLYQRLTYELVQLWGGRSEIGQDAGKTASRKLVEEIKYHKIKKSHEIRASGPLPDPSEDKPNSGKVDQDSGEKE